MRVKQILWIDVVFCGGLNLGESRIIPLWHRIVVIRLVNIVLILVDLEATHMSIEVIFAFWTLQLSWAFIGSIVIKSCWLLSLAVVEVFVIFVVVSTNFVSPFCRTDKTFLENSPRFRVIDDFGFWDFISGSFFIGNRLFHLSPFKTSILNWRLVDFSSVVNKIALLLQRVSFLLVWRSRIWSLVIIILVSTSVLSLVSVNVSCFRQVVSPVLLVLLIGNYFVNRLILVAHGVWSLVWKVYNFRWTLIPRLLRNLDSLSLVLNLLRWDLCWSSFW